MLLEVLSELLTAAAAVSVFIHTEVTELPLMTFIGISAAAFVFALFPIISFLWRSLCCCYADPPRGRNAYRAHPATTKAKAEAGDSSSANGRADV
jgi:hypothetical protein